MSRVEYDFNTKNNAQSWNINAYTISTISGDDLLLKPSASKSIVNIGNIVPASSNSYDLGNTDSIIRNIYVNRVIGDISGNLYGNALTCTKLEKTIKVGGMDFDGRFDIMLPGVNIAGNQDTGGNAGSASRLRNPKKIGGVEFNGLTDISLPGVDITGNQDTTGNADSATKLKNVIRIQGVPFDGTSSIWLPEIRETAILANSARKADALIVDGSYANILIREDDIYYKGLNHIFDGPINCSTITELKQKVESLESENVLIKNKLNTLLTLQGLTNV
tara:strand:- start:8 stop:838 length:831 start_codon:yes stop_codon:yes gene_type:complete